MTEVNTMGEYKCPNCGSTERVFDAAHKALEERGLHGNIEPYFRQREPVTLMDVKASVLSVPTVMLYWDHCKGCGQLYVFRIDTFDAPIQYMKQPKPDRTPFSKS